MWELCMEHTSGKCPLRLCWDTCFLLTTLQCYADNIGKGTAGSWPCWMQMTLVKSGPGS